MLACMSRGLGWCAVVVAALVAGCQASSGVTSEPGPAQPPPTGAAPAHYTFAAPYAWGGEARCAQDGCQAISVEHEAGAVVLHRLDGQGAQALDRQSLAYHPDSAKWITPGWVVAAVETGGTLDLFEVARDKLLRRAQIAVGFQPRDVTLVRSVGATHTLVATPYNGSEVAIVEWTEGQNTAQVKKTRWCETPWHPVRVAQSPGNGGAGLAVACLDARRVVFVPESDLTAPPRTLATFKGVPRSVASSPSGKWLYVAVETGDASARINLRTGETQSVKTLRTGVNAVAAIDDDTVVWGGMSTLELRRYDPAGVTLKEGKLPVSGFPTTLQLVDISLDGERDLLVLSSSGETADVYIGPLWP